MCLSLCPYLKESRKAGIKGTKEPLLRWSNASLLLLCSFNPLHDWTMTWVSDMSTDAENILSFLMSCRDHNHPCRRIFTFAFQLKMRWAYKYFPRETEMSRHHKVVKRPSSAVENEKWDFFKRTHHAWKNTVTVHTPGDYALFSWLLSEVRGRGSSLLLLRKKYVSMWRQSEDV